MDEQWRAIDGFPDYEVSSEGRVRSGARGVANRWGTLTQRPARVLRPVLDSDGYLRVSLYRDRRLTQRPIHHLVLEAFVGPRPSGTQTRHDDGNRKHNAAGNLNWGTPLENSADRTRHGTGPRGERNPKAKIDAEAARRILADRRTQVAIAADFGIDQTTVSRIKRGEIWAHGHCP
jgi:hypothetical protein